MVIFIVLTILLLPIFAGILELLLRRGYATCIASFVDLILLIYLYFYTKHRLVLKYFDIGNLTLALCIDKIWILYAISATLIILLVELYSIGYLWDDYRRGWFFMFSSLMYFGTLLLFFSYDLITITISWNILELCSYSLIGHWYRDEPERYVGEGYTCRGMSLLWSPSQAAFRAIMITSVGTCSMLIASCLAFTYAKSVLLPSLLKISNTLVQFLIIFATLVPSAQIPFTEWLFTAMAGPTPASAMIHSTTLVNAGAFTIFKIAPYLHIPSSVVQPLLIYTLSSTVVSGILGLASREVKVILAASTTIYVGLLLYTSILYWYTLNIDYLILGLVILLAHGLSKACLFMTCGYTMHVAKTRFIDDIKVFLRFRQAYTALILSSANLFGVIFPSLGFIMTEKSIELSPQYTIPLLLTTHIISILLLMKIILTFWKLKKEGIESIEEVDIKDRFMEYSTLIIMTMPYILYYFFRISIEITIMTIISQTISILCILLAIRYFSKIRFRNIIKILKLRLGLPYMIDMLIPKIFMKMFKEIYKISTLIDSIIHSSNIIKIMRSMYSIDKIIDNIIHFKFPRSFVDRVCRLVSKIHVEKFIRDLAYASILAVMTLLVLVIILHVI